MNISAILYVLGSLLVLTGSLMFPSFIVALVYGEGDADAFLLSAFFLIASGLPICWFFRKSPDLTIKDAFIILSLGWVLVCSVSTLPLMIHGVLPSFTDSFFEMMSGFTTTGATVLTDIEALPHGLLFWRSFTQFLGGMGFILITILLLPFMRMGGIALYRIKADSGQKNIQEKLNPLGKGVIVKIWYIYLVLVLFLAVLLWAGGMSLFDALCHAFGTLSTGGFSTKNASLGHYNSAYFEWLTIIFMFLSGVSFFLYYHLLEKDWESIKINTEFRWYFCLILLFCAIVSLILWNDNTYSAWDSIRHGTFQTISLLTKTGYTSDDYEKWPQSAQMFLFVVFFIGASAGSTASGIKMIHYVIILKYLYATLKKMTQPLQVIPIRVNRQRVDSRLVDLAASFFILNIVWVFLGGGLMVMLDDMDYFSSICAVTVTLMNIGPGLGEIGPSSSFYYISSLGKWFLSFSMLTGRLEIFSVIMLLYPSFWKE
ncbi:MAG: TrkH family potassium uptake protein [SAR324 cluster bacterium]|nr:TrkH family potassium uptake protein [SAR324 cluster bacterium]